VACRCGCARRGAVHDVLPAVELVDAGSGKEIWTHEFPKGRITTRGVNYWESRDRSDRRLLYANNQVLYAVDARTGESIASFGAKGGVDLREGLGRDPSKIAVQSATPGRVFEDLIIMGQPRLLQGEQPRH
jgi:quinoprotein glucose dehydrogenase